MARFRLYRKVILTMADRFKKVYTQGSVNLNEIWVDTETGVNYLFHISANAGGLTPLLDSDGKPVITDADGVGFKIEK